MGALFPRSEGGTPERLRCSASGWIRRPVGTGHLNALPRFQSHILKGLGRVVALTECTADYGWPVY